MTGLHGGDPRLRVVVGVAGVLVSGLQVDHDSVAGLETAAFRALNELPDRLHHPAWVVMQSGALGAAPAAAAFAVASGRPRLGARLLVGGVATWALAKQVKRAYRRPRPARLLAQARVRGKEATGMGYVSGHAGVVTALATAAWPELGPRGRVAVALVVPLVASTRVYVGAHLPLDVLGGAALGLAVQGAVDWVAGAATAGRLGAGDRCCLSR